MGWPGLPRLCMYWCCWGWPVDEYGDILPGPDGGPFWCPVLPRGDSGAARPGRVEDGTVVVANMDEIPGT